MLSGLSKVLLVLSCSMVVVVLSSYASSKDDKLHDDKKNKFLFFGAMVGGSHYAAQSETGKALVRQGHQVVSLVSSSNTDKDKTRHADIFSVLVFNSSYTQQRRADILETLAIQLVDGKFNTFWGPLVEGITSDLTGGLANVSDMWLRECDDLLADSITMKRLREERFDMLVADDHIPFPPLLAQALNIPFIYHGLFHPIPSKHGNWAGLPIDASYIPERALGLTPNMSFIQRVQNVLAHTFNKYWLNIVFDYSRFDQLKVKYNIKPEVSTLDSNKQASLYLFYGSFALDFPRPMQPNTIHILYTPGITSEHTIEEDIARFLDEAPNGVVLFSFGTHVRYMKRELSQVFADGFGRLPYRVLWQSNSGAPAGIKLADNIKIVKWLPLSQVMGHSNVQAFIGHGGVSTTYEALWAGLPMVGIPLFEDQMDNVVRVAHKGAGLSLDIHGLTSEMLSSTIRRVITEPKFRENAGRISEILRDLQTSSPPVDTAARWIIHVTRFGGEHLRPAVLDLTPLQRSLVDVYLFIVVALVTNIGAIFFLCRCCCKCMCGRKKHMKRE